MSKKELILDFRKFYQQDLDLLNYYGIYAPTRKIKYPIFLAFYCFIMFFFIISILNCSQYMYIIVETKNIRDFAGIGYVANISLMANVKAYYLFTQRKELLTLVNELNYETFQPTTEEAKLLAQGSLNFYKKVKTILTIIALVACTSSVTTPLVYPKNDGLPFAAWVPFNKSTTPAYQLIYIHQSFGSYYDTLVNTQVDILVVGCTTFIGIQCDLLCYQLALGKEKTFLNYIKYHQKIIAFANGSEKLFSKIYFLQFIATTSGLCMTLFLITLVDPYSFEFFFLVVYQAAIFNLLLVPSWFSSELRRKSENIPTAAYACPWLDAPKSYKKDLLFFIHRTQTPIQFQAIGFFSLSVQVFLKIVQSSFSYYTMLKSLTV